MIIFIIIGVVWVCAVNGSKWRRCEGKLVMVSKGTRANVNDFQKKIVIKADRSSGRKSELFR
jgi:hypothetical protein